MVSRKTNYVIDVDAPLEGAESPLRELFAFKKHLHNPHQLIADVGLTVLNVKLLLFAQNP